MKNKEKLSHYYNIRIILYYLLLLFCTGIVILGAIKKKSTKEKIYSMINFLIGTGKRMFHHLTPKNFNFNKLNLIKNINRFAIFNCRQNVQYLVTHRGYPWINSPKFKGTPYNFLKEQNTKIVQANVSLQILFVIWSH